MSDSKRPGPARPSISWSCAFLAVLAACALAGLPARWMATGEYSKTVLRATTLILLLNAGAAAAALGVFLLGIYRIIGLLFRERGGPGSRRALLAWGLRAAALPLLIGIWLLVHPWLRAGLGLLLEGSGGGT